MTSVVLLSSGQPSLNPRLVKEADALAGAGYAVTVLYAYWNKWGTEMDDDILPARNWQAIRVGGDPATKPQLFFFSRLLHKTATALFRRLRMGLFAEAAIARGSYFLIREAKKHLADIYIGHNLGALPATVKAATFYGKPCGFDAEDFHRNETSDDMTSANFALKARIEDKYLPRVNYLSVSSPLIGKAYHSLYAGLSPVSILNVFPKAANIAPKLPGDSVKLFWFSQTVSAARGLADCINALAQIKSKTELHLLGYADAQNREQLLGFAGGAVNLVFHPPVSPGDIAGLAAGFDIGLALEDGVPYNRDICLTNKIFTYMQAGLAIIASDTTAQQELMQQYPAAGKVYKKGDVAMLAQIIESYLDNPNELYAAKQASFEIARDELNWERERDKFLQMVEDTLAG